MIHELISKKTRRELREFLVGWFLREIEAEFDNADIPLNENYKPTEDGQRRRLVERYYASLDFSKQEDVKKFLKLLARVEHTENRIWEKI